MQLRSHVQSDRCDLVLACLLKCAHMLFSFRYLLSVCVELLLNIQIYIVVIEPVHLQASF